MPAAPLSVVQAMPLRSLSFVTPLPRSGCVPRDRALAGTAVGRGRDDADPAAVRVLARRDDAVGCRERAPRDGERAGRHRGDRGRRGQHGEHVCPSDLHVAPSESSDPTGIARGPCPPPVAETAVSGREPAWLRRLWRARRKVGSLPCRFGPQSSRSSERRSSSRTSSSPTPRPGRCSSGIEACGVCHTDLYTASGADPSGYAPAVLGHEGAGVVEAVGPDVTLVAPGDHVVTLFAPECGKCVHCLSPRTNRCTAIRDQQGLGYLPDGTARFGRDGEEIRHFMGTSTFAESHRHARDRARQGEPRGAARRLRAVRLRALDRDRRGALHRPRGARLHLRRLRLRPRRARRGHRRAPGRGRPDHRDRPLGGAPGRGAAPRRDRHAPRRRGHRRLDPRGDGRLRRRLHLRGDRQRRRDGARRSSPRGRPGASRP